MSWPRRGVARPRGLAPAPQAQVAVAVSDGPTSERFANETCGGNYIAEPAENHPVPFPTYGREGQGMGPGPCYAPKPHYWRVGRGRHLRRWGSSLHGGAVEEAEEE